MIGRSPISVVIKELIRFSLVGILNTTVGLGTIYLLMALTGLGYGLSNLIGYTLALANSFVMNHYWTFGNGQKFGIPMVVRFGLVFGVSYTLQVAVLAWLVEVVKVDAYVAQLVSMVVYTLANFIGNKFFTFSERRNGTEKS